MMINRRLFLGGAASTAALLALAACAKETSTAGDAVPTAPPALQQEGHDQGKTGGGLACGMTSKITNWNASHVDGNGVDLRMLMNFVNPSFFEYADDGTPTPNPDFIVSAKASEVDGKTVVDVVLNEKAVWGSGRQISADDFAASYAAAKDTNYRFASTDGIKLVEKVEKETDAKFKVVFESTYPDWSNVVSGCQPAELMKDAATFNTAMVSTFNNDYFSGPFKVDSWDDAAQIATLVPNERWWGAAPKLDKVTFRVLDSSGEATAFANKEIDVIDYIISSDVYKQALTRSDAVIRGNFGLQWRCFTINAANGILADVKVRQALMRATNREAIAKSDLAGLPVDVSKVLLGNRFFMPSQTGYQDNSGPWSYDPEAAKKLLDEAGWTVGANGTREKAGQPLKINFTIPQSTPTTENEQGLLQSQLAEVGITLEPVTVDTNKFFSEYLVPGNYEISAMTWQGTPYPMNNVGQIYGKGSESNYSDADIPEVDALIAQIDVEMDQTKRIELTNKVDALIWENVYNYPLYERMQLTAVPKGLVNFGAMGLASFRAQDIGYVDQ